MGVLEGYTLMSELPFGAGNESPTAMWLLGYYISDAGEEVAMRVRYDRLLSLRRGGRDEGYVASSGVDDVLSGGFGGLGVRPMNWLPELPADVVDLGRIWLVGYDAVDGVRRTVRVRCDSFFEFLGL